VTAPFHQQINAQRSSLLRRLEARLEWPMAILGFAWLVLLVLEFTGRVGPVLTRPTTVIWVLFVLDFLLKFIVAPSKLTFLRRNLLGAISLLIPALRTLRLLRVLRVARAVRGLRLLRLLTSLNRGFRVLGSSLRRRGFGYVVLSTLLVLMGGAAGMSAFESQLERYGDALWWTAMTLTTMGSDFWPQTAEGRLLCLLLSVYGFTMFGYLTATLATYFVASDSEQARSRAQSD
jgi:voltage-gated potassium channel